MSWISLDSSGCKSRTHAQFIDVRVWAPPLTGLLCFVHALSSFFRLRVSVRSEMCWCLETRIGSPHYTTPSRTRRTWWEAAQGGWGRERGGGGGEGMLNKGGLSCIMEEGEVEMGRVVCVFGSSRTLFVALLHLSTLHSPHSPMLCFSFPPFLHPLLPSLHPPPYHPPHLSPHSSTWWWTTMWVAMSWRCSASLRITFLRRWLGSTPVKWSSPLTPYTRWAMFTGRTSWWYVWVQLLSRQPLHTFASAVNKWISMIWDKKSCCKKPVVAGSRPGVFWLELLWPLRALTTGQSPVFNILYVPWKMACTFQCYDRFQAMPGFIKFDQTCVCYTLYWMWCDRRWCSYSSWKKRLSKPHPKTHNLQAILKQFPGSIQPVL